MAIELVAGEISNNPLYALSLIFIALGSVFLTLLYFKVVTKLFASDAKESKKKKIPFLFSSTSFAFLAMLIVGIFTSLDANLLPTMQIVTPMLLIAVVPILFGVIVFKKAHRVKEYNCGEKDEVQLNMYYFDISQKSVKIIYAISLALMITLVVGVAS